MDMERYGDYTEYEEDVPKSKNKFLLVMKILILTVCFSVVGIIAFRIILLNIYPDSVEDIYFTDNLRAYYNETDGDIGAKTQELRYNYDDEKVGNFFCDNLIVIEGAGELQISVRYNVSTLKNIEAKYGLKDLDPDSFDHFTFRLTAPDGSGTYYDSEKTDPKTVVVSSEPSYVGTDSMLMYRYFKLVFDGIDFTSPQDPDEPHPWIRLEIFVKGQTDEQPFAKVLIYENNDGDDKTAGYNKFEDYVLSKKELPY